MCVDGRPWLYNHKEKKFWTEGNKAGNNACHVKG